MIIKYLSSLLYMSDNEVINFAQTSPHRYKVYEIPKRNCKGTRIIAHPSKELKFIQKLLIHFLTDKLPIHNCAYAYRKGLGIKDNAARHKKSKYLLKMDFENFFPSITPDLFFKITTFHGLEFNEKDKAVLTGFLFWKPKGNNSLVLSIGAPTSPLISNFVMNLFDDKLNNECINKKITYTRYADDITFSTRVKNVLFEVPNIVEKCLKEYCGDNIKINKAKTVFTSQAHNRHVTGITISNDGTLSLGREKKRLISSMIHKVSLGLLPNEELPKLQGLIAHSSHIEPLFYERMLKKYGLMVMTNIKNP